jgi:hypothetical protein
MTGNFMIILEFLQASFTCGYHGIKCYDGVYVELLNLFQVELLILAAQLVHEIEK